MHASPPSPSLSFPSFARTDTHHHAPFISFPSTLRSPIFSLSLIFSFGCRYGLICDFLWSDPSGDVLEWAESDRGVSYVFGRKAVDKFIKKFGFELVVRAHQVCHASKHTHASTRMRAGAPLPFSPTFACALTRPSLTHPLPLFLFLFLSLSLSLFHALFSFPIDRSFRMGTSSLREGSS